NGPTRAPSAMTAAFARRKRLAFVFPARGMTGGGARRFLQGRKPSELSDSSSCHRQQVDRRSRLQSGLLHTSRMRSSGAAVGYTRASCFSELFGLPGPSPHQSLAVRVHIPVESSSSTTFDIGTPTVERCLVIQRPPGVGAFQFVVLASLRAAQLVR